MRAINKRRLSALYVEKVKPQARSFLVWDLDQKGLALQVQPTGHRAYKVIYHCQGRSRWFNIGDAKVIGLADARLKTAELMLTVIRDGKDPVAERRAGRQSTTLGTLATRYVEEYAKRRNKSWRQADTLVRRYVLPAWAEIDATAITRSDVRNMLGKINGPVLANQVLASASAIFTWATRQELLATNPCKGIERHATVSRERVLSDTEVPLFWKAFEDAGLPGMALQVLLLTGQRPGEVAHMRHEHIIDGWWELPGQPSEGWPGTKNGASHRVWLPARVREMLAGLSDDGDGFVFGPSTDLSGPMRNICRELKATRATPHDLRRTHGSTITALGFGRDAMNRIQNHKEGGIASVYDRHGYAAENTRIMEATAAKLLTLAEGKTALNVVTLDAKR
jgi:integrase